MRKTLFIYSANYLPNIGGVEKYTYNLANQLELLGVHACIVTNNVFNLAEEETLESGATVYRLPCHPLIGGRLPVPKRNTPFKDLLERIYSHGLCGRQYTFLPSYVSWREARGAA